MNDALVQSILGFTLDARKVLEREADEQLQGIYGWLTDGTFTPANKMPAVGQLPEAKETRARLERFKDDEATAGLDAKAARKKLLRETAFTWLNRLVAFRMMEERRLLRGTISRLHSSGAYVSWVTADGNLEARQLHDAGEVPANLERGDPQHAAYWRYMSEGPRHVAYRRFLLWQCGELAREESVLFDPGTLPSRLCPRPPIFKQLVDAMNAENLVEAWKAGNEEVLGWTYEGFIEEENGEVFEKFSKGKKVLPEEIGAATQRFTPRWIVRYLVENSLGRIWVEMHPDSRLAKSLGYLVPVEKKSTRPVKPVREIDFLDPSCGSMHFGLVAFDLFVEMYREELERAGQPGWPAKASVAKVEEIPSSIVRHNLFGIDLDLRAVQIAALTMMIKARTLQPGCAVTDLNFACANMEQISGGRLDAIVSQAKFKHPIYESVLRGLVSRMKNSDQLGSLLRPEKVLQELIAAERRKAEENLLLLPGLSPNQFKTPGGLEDFFSNLSEQILQQLDGFVQTSRAAGQDPGHLVAEASKGLRFLRLVSRHYDVVATNPPYLSRGNMSAVMTIYLDDHFVEGRRDLYAAFIMRCMELADKDGKVAMVTQQSFMFLGIYEDLRLMIRAGFAIDTMIHLGPRAFPNITGEKVNTTAFVFEKRASKVEGDNQKGVYFRLVQEPDADSKRRAFEMAVGGSSSGHNDEGAFCCLQKNFDAIPGAPLVYWISDRIRKIFETFPPLTKMATPVVGCFTCDNVRFLRFWWEVGRTNICFKCESIAETVKAPGRWFPHLKGGGSSKWHGNEEYVINLRDAGEEVRTFRAERGQSRSLPGERFYFTEGLTWSRNAGFNTSFRIVRRGRVLDVNSSFIHVESRWRLGLLGILNTPFTLYCKGLLNPTISLQAGDIERLPVPSQRNPKIDECVDKCIKLANLNSRDNEMTYDFVLPTRSQEGRAKRQAMLEPLEAEINAQVYGLYGLAVDEQATIHRELSGESVMEAADNADEDRKQDDEDAQGDFTPGDWARSWISYAAGAVLGRFEIGKTDGLGCGDFSAATVNAIRPLVDPDGIMPCDEGHPQDIASRLVKCLGLMLGVDEARNIIRTATGESGDSEKALRGWLDRFAGSPEKSFWKYHFQLYRKRPVYWPLQSPRKKYTVWIFHERFDKNTLFTVRNLVEERLRLLERKITDMRPAAANNRGVARDLDKLVEMADDLREFSKRIKEITDRGYTPHIDDGVLLNAAPLHPLLPSWSETRTAWAELEAGDYDWAQQAMEYWPARVKAACQTNKSFAIAHGLA